MRKLAFAIAKVGSIIELDPDWKFEVVKEDWRS